MHGALSFYTALIDRQPTVFNINGRERKCLVRRIPDSFEDPTYRFETKWHNVDTKLLCVYGDNKDIKVTDIIEFEGDKYEIIDMTLRAQATILTITINKYIEKNYNIRH